MKEFTDLLLILERLLAPDGCPWDKLQTLQSLRTTLVEESYEVVDAIDSNYNHAILEELGDLFFNALFLCKIAEREGRFPMSEVLYQMSQKLIRRHPHIFGEGEQKTKIENTAQLYKQWEQIKKEEKKSQKSSLDSLPADLPSLLRAQKVAKKCVAKGFHYEHIPSGDLEEQGGAKLWLLTQELVAEGIHPDQALRKYLGNIERAFRVHEQQSES